MGWANMHTHLDGEAEATREIPQKIKKTPLGEIHGQAPNVRHLGPQEAEDLIEENVYASLQRILPVLNGLLQS